LPPVCSFLKAVQNFGNKKINPSGRYIVTNSACTTNKSEGIYTKLIANQINKKGAF
jgi:hypothetical protein